MMDLRDRRGRITRLVIALLAGWFSGYASSFAIAAAARHMPQPEHLDHANELPFYGAVVVGIGVFVATLAIASSRAKRAWQTAQVAQARVR